MTGTHGLIVAPRLLFIKVHQGVCRPRFRANLALFTFACHTECPAYQAPFRVIAVQRKQEFSTLVTSQVAKSMDVCLKRNK